MWGLSWTPSLFVNHAAFSILTLAIPFQDFPVKLFNKKKYLFGTDNSHLDIILSEHTKISIYKQRKTIVKQAHGHHWLGVLLGLCLTELLP